MSKNYSNKDKYWEYDEEDLNYKLHFTRFYEDEIIAIMFSSDPDEDDVMLWADYKLKNVYENYPEPLTAETIEEAKAEVEERIVDLVQEQVEYLQSWIHKFKSTDDEDGEDFLHYSVKSVCSFFQPRRFILPRHVLPSVAFTIQMKLLLSTVSAMFGVFDAFSLLDVISVGTVSVVSFAQVSPPSLEL